MYCQCTTTSIPRCSGEQVQYSQFERDSRRFGRGAQLECEQIYAKVFGADDEETLDAAMRALTVGEEEEHEEGEEGNSDQGEDEDQAGDSTERERECYLLVLKLVSSARE